MASHSLFEIVVLLAAVVIYFLPAMIADRRARHDLLTIALFNAVIGWTVLGWLLALYWALQPNPPRTSAATSRCAAGASACSCFRAVSTTAFRHAAHVATPTPRPPALPPASRGTPTANARRIESRHRVITGSRLATPWPDGQRRRKAAHTDAAHEIIGPLTFEQLQGRSSAFEPLS